MLVSVIIPAFNAGNRIVKTLESMKNQTYSNMEILVVLDGCTDDTLEWCKKCQLQDERIKIIEQENQGVYAARYNGIKHANGEYLMFCDSDDYISENAVEKLVEVVERNKSDLVRFRYEKITNGETQYFQEEYFKNVSEMTIDKEEFKEKVYPFFLNSYMISSIWTNFVKRKYVPEKQTEERLSFAEDLLFNIDCFSKIERVTFVNEPFYKYCTTEGSITRTYDVAKLLNNLRAGLFVYLKLYEYALKWGYSEEILENLKIRILYELSTIIAKMNKSNENVDTQLNEIFANEKYQEFKEGIDKSKISSEIVNYDIIINLL